MTTPQPFATPLELLLMRDIADNPGILGYRLATLAGRNRYNVAHILRRLEARDLIERRYRPNSRRPLYLTPAGATLAASDYPSAPRTPRTRRPTAAVGVS